MVLSHVVVETGGSGSLFFGVGLHLEDGMVGSTEVERREMRCGLLTGTGQEELQLAA